MIGIIGRKKGMGSVYDDKGKRIAVTVIEAGPCAVTQVKTTETDGYNALQLGFGDIRTKLVTKPLQGHFNKSGKNPYRHLHEFRNFSEDHSAGDILTVEMFNAGDKVNLSGKSKGRGFAGVIKRHGFHMPPATHGTHEKFRGGGSIGAASYPAKVWRGHKMPGHMGNQMVTVKNLKVVSVDVENSLIVIKGAVPGMNGSCLFIRRD
jgi:large subunit ribosomal protein L3